jgi:hypothetical protein
VQLDDETWNALRLLASGSMRHFEELADEAFRDLLAKHGRHSDPGKLWDVFRRFYTSLGLIPHLTRFGNVHQCKITEAAFELGRNYVERRYGEAERAAKAAADEEKERLTASRRVTDTLYKVHPTEPPELIDEGYRSWFGKNRDTEGLAWAESRVKSLGFQKHVEGNVQSLEQQRADYVIYADIRSQKKITFNVFRLPITKGKKVWESNFDFPDYFKHDIEDKYEARLKEALERFHRH